MLNQKAQALINPQQLNTSPTTPPKDLKAQYSVKSPPKAKSFLLKPRQNIQEHENLQPTSNTWNETFIYSQL